LPPNEPEASLAKNLTGGGGCGCGCLGLLVIALGMIAIGGIYIELYENGLDVTAWYGGLGAIATGAAMALVGGIVFIGSLFLD
jgi:hypothetical protein